MNDTVVKLIQKCNFPLRLTSIEYDVNTNPKLSAYVNNYIELKTDVQMKEGLYLWGKSDAGKTTIALNIAKQIVIEKKTKSVYYVNCSELIDELFRIQDGSIKVDDSLLRFCKQVELLILDEVGLEKVSDFIGAHLYRLINYRYDRKLPMIITSNFNISGFKKRFTDQLIGERIESRLYKTCMEIPISGF
jgi:DNA replication protein DnaC